MPVERKTALRHPLTALWLVALVLVWLQPSPVLAFYDRQQGGGSLELLGFLELGGAISRNPDNPLFYDTPTSLNGSTVLRLLLNGHWGSSMRYGANLLEAARSTNNSPSVLLPFQVNDPERSGLLAWRHLDNGHSQALLTLDSLNLQILSKRCDITIGRQAVNLATTFYFTPNDFFAPFVAQTFYRVYKPGVDGVRADFRLGELSLLSLLGVLGYEKDRDSDNGWSCAPDWGRSSLLARLAANRFGFEWGLLGGRVRDDSIVGGFLQGEIFNWLTIRAEGHYAATAAAGTDDAAEVALGVEHRFPSSLNLRLEQFYHGRGYTAIAEINSVLQGGDTLPSPYLGRHYTAMGASYQFSPLLTGQLLAAINWSDRSGILTLNSVYSLADEADFTAAITVPVGDRTQGLNIGSEYGLLPVAATIEYRFYF